METVDFVELYERTLDEVHGYASRLAGGDRIRTDELVQETYRSVMRRLRTDGAPIEPNLVYLLVTCRSRFPDQLRSERRRRIREERVARSDAAVAPIDPSDLDPGRVTGALANCPTPSGPPSSCGTSTTWRLPTSPSISTAACGPPNHSWPGPARHSVPRSTKGRPHEHQHRPARPRRRCGRGCSGPRTRRLVQGLAQNRTRSDRRRRRRRAADTPAERRRPRRAAIGAGARRLPWSGC